MLLVDYPDTNSDSEEQDNSKKRKAEDADVAPPTPRAPPPLPPSFHSLYATSVRTSTVDDPTLHAGRTRQIPHVVGNWPTHVYLEWYPSKDDLALLARVIEKAGHLVAKGNTSPESTVHSFLHSDLGVQLPLHVSLSAPLVLRTEQKDPFQERIGTNVAHRHVKPFTAGVTGLDWVANHDRSRHFLVLKMSKPEDDELNTLLSLCNATARQLGLPQLYSEDSHKSVEARSGAKVGHAVADRSDAFHISIAWTLEQPSEQARRELVDLEQDQLHALKVSFSMLKLKMGNVVSDIAFSERTGARMA